MKKAEGSLRLGYFPLFLVIFLGIELGLGIPIGWKTTRMEAWVRVGARGLHYTLSPVSHLTEQYGPIQGQIFIVTPAPLRGSPICCGLGSKKAKFFFLLIC